MISGFFEFKEDIINGRNRNSGITSNKGIVFIERFTADRTDVASGSVKDDAGSRIDDSVIDLTHLITFDFRGKGITNGTWMRVGIEFKKDGKRTKFMRDTNIADISAIQAKSREKVTKLKRRRRSGIVRQGNHQLSELKR